MLSTFKDMVQGGHEEQEAMRSEQQWGPDDVGAGGDPEDVGLRSEWDGVTA